MENLIANALFFFKGRVALYALLKAIGVHTGDEVILPGFTCVGNPNYSIYLGCKTGIIKKKLTITTGRSKRFHRVFA